MDSLREQIQLMQSSRSNCGEVEAPKAVLVTDEDDLLAIFPADANGVYDASFVVSPRASGKLYWDVLVGFFIIWSVVLLPFRIAFEISSTGGMFVFDCIIDICFGIDMILNFRTGYFTDQELYVADPRKIAKRYLSGFFLPDLLSTVPFDLIVGAIMGGDGSANVRSVKLIRVVRLVRLAKLMKLFKLGKYVDQFAESTGIDPAAIQLGTLMCKIMFVAHLLSCAWYFIATPVCGDADMPSPLSPCAHLTEEERDSNWVLYKGVDYLTLKSRYMAAFHWVTATMMSVGYGDIFARNTLERLFSVWVMVVGATAFGFILSIVTILLDSTSTVEQASRQRNEQLKEWMVYRDLPEFLSKRIKAHFTYAWAQKSVLPEYEILSGLPTRLRNQILETAHEDKLVTLKCVFEHQSLAFYLELVQHFEAHQLLPGEIVLEPWESTRHVYILTKGAIEGTLDPLSSDGNSVMAGAGKMNGFTSHGGCARVAPLDGTVKANIQNGRASTASGESHSDEILAAMFEDNTMMGHADANPLRHRCIKMSDMLVVKKDTLTTIVERFPDTEARFNQEVLSRNQIITEVLSLKVVTHAGRFVQEKVFYYGEAVKADQLPHNLVRLSTIADDAAKPLFRRSAGTKGLGEMLLHTRRVAALGSDIEEVEESPGDLLKRWIIPPTNATKLKWDLLIGALIIYSVVCIPYRIGFGVDATDPIPVAFDIFVDICFVVDMILMFRTAFADIAGVIDTCPKHIMSRYLKGWFAIDFFSTFPIDRVVEAFLSQGDSSKARAVKLIRVVRLARLLKLVRMLKMGPIMKHFDEVVGNSPLLVKFSKLGLALVLLGHLIGCFWFFVGMSADSDLESCESGTLNCEPGGPAMTWYDALGITKEMRDAQYVAAFYWAFTTMTTVGYGDIYPMSDTERIYAIIMMIGGATVFGYISGSIAALASEDNGGEAMIRKRVDKAMDFCEEQNICARTISAVKMHTNFFYQEKSPFAESEFLEDLPGNLRKAVTLHIHQEVIEKICLFSPGRQPDWFIAAAVRLLEPQVYVAEEVIIKPTRPQQEIFFVHDGICEAYMVLGSSASATPLAGRSKSASPEPTGTVADNPNAVNVEGNNQVESPKDIPKPREQQEPQAPALKQLESPMKMPGSNINDGLVLEEWGPVQHVYNPGCVFGVEALLDHKHRHLVCCSDRGPCFLYVLKDQVLADVQSSQPGLLVALQRALAEAVHEQVASGRTVRNAERKLSKEVPGGSNKSDNSPRPPDHSPGPPNIDVKKEANGCAS